MKRKGFTLVELLIVIVVIGILAAMMMLSSNEAVSTAKANNIASNLRNLKTAALSLYTDNMASYDKYSREKATQENAYVEITNDVFKYLNGKTDLPEKDKYKAYIRGGKWYVAYMFSGNMAGRTAIQHKLAGRAEALGILQGKNDVIEGPYKGDQTENHTAILRVR